MWPIVLQAYLSSVAHTFCSGSQQAVAHESGENVTFCECAPRIYFERIFSGSSIFVRGLLYKYFLRFRGILQTLPNIASIPGLHRWARLLSHHPFPAAQLSGPKRKEHLVAGEFAQPALEFFIFNRMIKQCFWQHRKFDTCLLLLWKGPNARV